MENEVRVKRPEKHNLQVGYLLKDYYLCVASYNSQIYFFSYTLICV